MGIRHLNLNSLFIFRTVFEHLSMTKAAKVLAMTQPGVSQHIFSLEENLNIKLFYRQKRGLLPSREAESLFETLLFGFGGLEQVLLDISGGEKQLRGKVRVGVPIEFGNNVVLPLLAKINQKMEFITFKIYYGLAEEMNQMLLQGKLDFAFVDQFKMNSTLKVEHVFNEALSLCCSKNYLKTLDSNILNKKNIEKFRFVAYMENGPIICNWLEQAQGITKPILNIVSESMDVQGVAHLILNDLGVGVLPEHFLSHLSKKKLNQLYIFKAKKKNILNSISLVYHEGRLSSPLLKYVYEHILETLEEKMQMRELEELI